MCDLAWKALGNYPQYAHLHSVYDSEKQALSYS
jgi:hypothetical protein